MRQPLLPALLGIWLSASFPVAAQDTSHGQDAERLPDPPIVVIANPDAAERVVTAGSRLPQKNIFANSGIASSVGTRGLGPQSGMSPHSRVRGMKKKDCVSEDPALGKVVICTLATGDDLLAAGDMDGALTMYRSIAYSSENSARERHVASEKLYAAADQSGAAELREEGLIALLANGGLNPGEARSARRTLVALALSENDRIKAIRRLENVVKHHPEDADSLANLAILQEAEGIAGSRATMQRAIAIRNSAGRSVPAGWSRFAAAD